MAGTHWMKLKAGCEGLTGLRDRRRRRARLGLAGGLAVALVSLALSPALVDVSLALKDQAQAACTVGVRMVNDLRLVWEIRAFLNRPDPQPMPPANSRVPTGKTCTRG